MRPLSSRFVSPHGYNGHGWVLVEDVEFRRHLVGRIRASDGDLRLFMSLTSEVTQGPSNIAVIVERGNDMAETTVFLDTDKMMNLAIGASHESDGARHDYEL